MINAIRLGATTHATSGSGTQVSDIANSYDGSLSTYWSIYYYEANGVGSAFDGDTVLTHTFAAAMHIDKVAFKLNCGCSGASGASQNLFDASFDIEIYYSGGWHSICSDASGAKAGDDVWNSSYNNVYTELTNGGAGWDAVEKIRITYNNRVYRLDEGAGGGHEESHGYTYELEAFVNDQVKVSIIG